MGRSLVAEGGVSGAGDDQLPDEGGQRLGKDDGFAAEPEKYFLLVGLNMVEGQAADRGGPLGVEQNEQPGDAVLRFDALVVDQAPGLGPAGLGVDDARGSVPFGSGEVQAGQLVAFGPAHEVPGLAAAGGLAAQPGVEVALRDPPRLPQGRGLVLISIARRGHR